MTEDQLKEIEARAKAATPGPWRHERLNHDDGAIEHFIGTKPDYASVAFYDGNGEWTPNQGANGEWQAEYDAAHIAGMSPSTTLALVEEVRRLREALSWYAVRARYHDTPLPNNQWKTAEVVFDGGKIARNALGEAGRG